MPKNLDFGKKFCIFANVIWKRHIASVNGFPAGKPTRLKCHDTKRTNHSIFIITSMWDNTNCIPMAEGVAINDAMSANTEHAGALNESKTKDNPANNIILEYSLEAEEFLHQHYALRRNVLSNKVEFRSLDNPYSVFTPLTEEDENSMIIQSLHEGLDIMSTLRLLLKSNFVPRYDPIVSWLNSLEWDGEDRLSDFWHRIPGMSVDLVYLLVKWMRSMVAYWMHIETEHSNECVPTLIGDQGCGKSTFCRRILPPHLRQYYVDHVNLSNKNDKNMVLTDALLACLDEMDQYKVGQQAELKQMLSITTVNRRMIYGRHIVNRPRYCSFIGTTNNPRPLQDATGSRRFLCINIPKGKIIDNETAIDYEQIYAQLMHEVMTSMCYWYPPHEVELIQKMNAPYMKEKGIDQMIVACFRPASNMENAQVVNSEQVITTILKAFPEADHTKLNKVAIGRAMIKLGFAKQHRENGVHYFVESKG